MPEDRFCHSRRMAWTGLASIIALCGANVVYPSPEAAQVTTVAIGSIAGLVAAWTGITNWADVTKP